MIRRVLARSICVLACFGAWPICGCGRAEPDATFIRGRVVDEDQRPLANARVRIKATAVAAICDAGGRFSLPAPRSQSEVRVTAAHPGFFIGGGDWKGDGELLLTLLRHPTADNPSHIWIDPRPDPADDTRCGNCHAEIFREWSESSHARSASNPRFLDVLNGTTAEGRRDVGWNLRKEYPGGEGVCLACHVPGIEPSIHAPQQFAAAERTERTEREEREEREEGEDATLGVHCDLCHKIADVARDEIGLSHGRFGLQLIRPAAKEKLLFGPLDDVDRGEDVHSPLYRDSVYCARCHEGILFGAHAYSTFTEWEASPYAARRIHCQQCHMRPTGKFSNIAPGHGGVDRDPMTLASHTLPGSDPAFLREHLLLTATAEQQGDQLVVTTKIQPHNIGHCVPTGHPARQLLLWVRAVDPAGQPLEQLSGPRLPELAGTGELAAGGLFNQPGKLYAKVFVSNSGDPHVPYWSVATEGYDTRLQPDEPDQQQFTFRSVPPAAATLDIRLLYRRFPHRIAQEKAWTENETLVHRREIAIAPAP